MRKWLIFCGWGHLSDVADVCQMPPGTGPVLALADLADGNRGDEGHPGDVADPETAPFGLLRIADQNGITPFRHLDAGPRGAEAATPPLPLRFVSFHC